MSKKQSQPLRSSRADQAEATRERILAAAVELIDENGEAGLRVVEVGVRADISTASIYTHFANRDELVVAARIEQYLEAVGDDVRYIGEVVERASNPGELVAMMREVSRAASANDRADLRWRRAEIVGAARRRPKLAAQLGKKQHEVNAELTRIAQRGQQRGLIDPKLDATALAVFVQAFTFGLLLADIDAEAGLDPESWLDVVSRFTTAVTPAQDK